MCNILRHLIISNNIKNLIVSLCILIEAYVSSSSMFSSEGCDNLLSGYGPWRETYFDEIRSIATCSEDKVKVIAI